MDHVHFDRNAVVKALKEQAKKSCDLALSEFTKSEDRAYIQAQYEISQAMADAFGSVVDMRNAGRSAAFVGSVLGSALGTIVVNTLRNVDNPTKCLLVMASRLNASIDNAVGRGDGSFTSAGAVAVPGERGGWA